MKSRNGAKWETLLSCFAGRVASITGSLALGLQPNFVLCLSDGRTFVLLGLFCRECLTFCGDARVPGNALGFSLRNASLPRSAHSRPSSPPCRNLWIIRAGSLTELGRHHLLCVPGGTQSVVKIFLLHSAH